MESRTERARARWIRLAVLVGVLAFSTIMGLLHISKSTSFVPVGVDALCPFGGIEALWAFIADGFLIKRIAFSSMVLLIATLLVAVFAGRAFCGQLCPLGALQELFGRLGSRLGISRRELPQPLDRAARLLKYLVLIVITGATWMLGTLVIRPYDPWAAYHHLTSPELFTEFAVGAIILGIAVFGSLVYNRFFCRYVCPMGAFLGIISRFSWLKVRRVEDICTDCGRCDTACPVGIDVSCASCVDSSECIACSECVNSCPQPGALTVSDRKGMTITPLTLTLATVVIFFGVLAVSTAAGVFEWEKPTPGSEMRRIEQSGGIFDTSVIKGSTTMNQIAEGTGIPADTLAQTFGLNSADMDTPLKEVKAVYGFSMWDVRAFVAAQLGLPAPEQEAH